MIDDGSTDGSGQIYMNMLKNDLIKVIHKNAGLGMARNHGDWECFRGTIVFIDSDDYIANDYIEYLNELANKRSWLS